MPGPPVPTPPLTRGAAPPNSPPPAASRRGRLCARPALFAGCRHPARWQLRTGVTLRAPVARARVSGSSAPPARCWAMTFRRVCALGRPWARARQAAGSGGSATGARPDGSFAPGTAQPASALGARDAGAPCPAAGAPPGGSFAPRVRCLAGGALGAPVVPCERQLRAARPVGGFPRGPRGAELDVRRGALLRAGGRLPGGAALWRRSRGRGAGPRTVPRARSPHFAGVLQLRGKHPMWSDCSLKCALEQFWDPSSRRSTPWATPRCG